MTTIDDARDRALEIVRIVYGFEETREIDPCGIVGAQINNELTVILSALELAKWGYVNPLVQSQQDHDDAIVAARLAVDNIKTLADALAGKDGKP